MENKIVLYGNKKSLELWEKALKTEIKRLDLKLEPKFYIGVDTYDKNNLAYCLTRNTEDVVEVILSKTSNDKKIFEEEVENLSKYFNAIVLKEIN